jgi:arsenate reductase
MAEALLTHLGTDRFVAHSAGSNPAGFIHPLVEIALGSMGIPLHPHARSKSWDEFENKPMDLIITVCDSAASQCPSWIRSGRVAHWPLPDPSFVIGTEDERIEIAVRVAERLRLKIERMMTLDFDGLDDESLDEQLRQIGQL